MPDGGSPHDDGRLVPTGRFGAALFRCRGASGESLAALARASGGRWLPDQLVEVERTGASPAPLTDDDVCSLVGLYGLAPAPWTAPAELELVLDRATASDLTPATAVATDRGDTLRWLAARFVALSVLVGLDVTSGPLDLGVLAEAFELPVPAAVELVRDVMHRHADEVGEMIAVVSRRVAVPAVGYLVGEAPMGSLLLARRRAGGGEANVPVVPACGTVVDLAEAARAAAEQARPPRLRCPRRA